MDKTYPYHSSQSSLPLFDYMWYSRCMRQSVGCSFHILILHTAVIVGRSSKIQSENVHTRTNKYIYQTSTCKECSNDDNVYAQCVARMFVFLCTFIVLEWTQPTLVQHRGTIFFCRTSSVSAK